MLFINFLCLLYLMVLSNGYIITKSINKEYFDEVSNAVTKLDRNELYGVLHQRYRREEKINKRHNAKKITKICPKAFTNAAAFTTVTITSTERLKHKSPKRKFGEFWRKSKGKKERKGNKGGEKEGRRINKEIHQNVEDKAARSKHQKIKNKKVRIWKSATHDFVGKNNVKNKRSLHLLRRSETTLKRDTTKPTVKKIKAVSSIRIGITPQAVGMSKNGFKSQAKIIKNKGNDDVKSTSTKVTCKKKKYKLNNYKPIAPNHVYENMPPKLATVPTEDQEQNNEFDFLKTAQIEDLLNNIKFKTIQMISESNSSLGDMIINSATEKFITIEPFLIHMPSTMSRQSFQKFVAINNGNKLKAKVYKQRALNRTVTIGYDEPHDMYARSLTANTIEIANNVIDDVQQKIKKVLKKMKAKVSSSYKNSTIQKVTKRILNKIKPCVDSKFSKSSPMKPVTSKPPKENKKTTIPITPPKTTKTNKQKHTTTKMKSQRSLPTFDDTVMPLYEDMLEKSQQDIAAKKKTSKLPFNRKDKKHHRLHKRNRDSSMRHIEDTVYDEKTDDYLEPGNFTEDSLTTSTTMKPIEGTSYNSLTSKISYNDYVNGYKHYLQFQKDQAKDNFSAMVKYQAHKHHNVDDIGKYILEKIPKVPTLGYMKSGKRRKRFFDDNDIDDQEVSTKTDESWFKKHFYVFIDNGPSKKFHTSQTVSLKSPLTETPYLESKKTKKSRHGQKEFYTQFSDNSDSTSDDDLYADPTLDYLSETFLKKANKLYIPHSQGKSPTTDSQSVTTLFRDISNVTSKPLQLNFIAQLFGKKYRRTLKTEISRTTLDSGDRIKRASQDEDITENEPEDTILAKDPKDDDKKKDNNKYGYVDINVLVPKGAADVKLRETTTNKNKFKEFLKKFRFKSKTKKKRSCNPFKKLKDIFRSKDDKSTKPLVPINKYKYVLNFSNTTPYSKSVNEENIKKTSRAKIFTHAKVDKALSFDEIRKQVPNINDTDLYDTTWTSTTPLPEYKNPLKESQFLIKNINKNKKYIAKTSSPIYNTANSYDGSWSLTTPIPGYKSDLDINSQHDPTFTKPTKKHVIFVKPISDFGTATPETKSTTSLEIKDDILASRNPLDFIAPVSDKDDTDVFSVTVTKSNDEPTRTISPSEAGEDYDNLEFNFAKNNAMVRNVGDDRETTAQSNIEIVATEKTRQDEKRESAAKIKVTRHINIPRIYFNLNRTHQLLRQRFSVDNNISETLENTENDKYIPEIKYDDKQADLFQNAIENFIFKDASNDEYKKPDYFDDLINWDGDILNKDNVQPMYWNNTVQQHDLENSLSTPNVHDMMSELKMLNNHKFLKPLVTVTNEYNNENKKSLMNNLTLVDKTTLKNKNVIKEVYSFKSNRPMDIDFKISNQSSTTIPSLNEFPESGYVTRLIHRDIPTQKDRYSVARDLVNKLVTLSRGPETSMVPERQSSNFREPLMTVTVIMDTPSGFKTDTEPIAMSTNDIYIKDVRRGDVKSSTDSTPALMIDTTLLSYDDELQNVAEGIHLKKLSRSSLPRRGHYLITTRENFMTKLNKQPQQSYTTPLPMKSKEFEKFLKDEGMDVKSLKEPMAENTTKISAMETNTKSNANKEIHLITKSYNKSLTSIVTKKLLEFNERYKKSVNNFDIDDFDRNRLKKNMFGKLLHTINDEPTFETTRELVDNISLAISNLHKKAKELPIIDMSDLNDETTLKTIKDDNVKEHSGINYPNAYLPLHNHLLYNNLPYQRTFFNRKIIKNSPTMGRYFTIPYSDVYRPVRRWQTSRKQPKKVEINSHHLRYDIFYDENDNVEITTNNPQSSLKVDKTYMKHPKISERPCLYKTAEQSKIYITRQRMRRARRRLIRKVNAPEKSFSSTLGNIGSGITKSIISTYQRRSLDVLSSKFFPYPVEPMYKVVNNKVSQTLPNEGFVIKVERANTTTTAKNMFVVNLELKTVNNCSVPLILRALMDIVQIDIAAQLVNKSIMYNESNKTKSKDHKWLTIYVHPIGKLIDDKEIFINELSSNRPNSGISSTQVNAITTLNNDNTESTQRFKIPGPFIAKVEDNTSKNFKEPMLYTCTDKYIVDSDNKVVDMFKSVNPNINNSPSIYTKFAQELETLHSDSSAKYDINSALEEFAKTLIFNHFKATVKIPVRDLGGIYTTTPFPKRYNSQTDHTAISSSLNIDDTTRISRLVYFEPISHKVQQIYDYGNYAQKSNDDLKQKKNSEIESLDEQKITPGGNLHLDKKRDVQDQEVFTAKDVAAIEVIVDLMKNTLSYEDKDVASVFSNNLMLVSPAKSVQQSQDTTNSIQVHIAIPFDVQLGKKRSALDPMRVRRVFSAKMSKPVDLEYQIHSFEDMPESTTAMSTTPADVGLSSGVYLLINKPNNGYALKPVKANVALSNIKYRQITTPLNQKKQESTRRDYMKEMGKVTLSKDLISAINKQLVEIYENFTTARSSAKLVRRKRAVHSTTFSIHRNKPRAKDMTKFKIDPRYRIRRFIDWDALENYFGLNRVCSCKCKPYKPMCRACAASDIVMNELIFEFNNIEQYMKDHCTELQTYFWMNPSGGLRLRDTVHNIDKSLNDYYKRVRGKCQGKTCKALGTNIDKRDFIKIDLVPKERYKKQMTVYLASLSNDLNRIVRMSTCSNHKFIEEGGKMLRAINSCIFPKNYNKRSHALTTKKKFIKNIYSLDNINVNIICKPDSQTKDSSESPEATTTPTTTFSSASTNTISTNTISTDTISTDTISTDAISTDSISTDAISTDAISTNTISTNTISNDTMSADSISNDTTISNTLTTVNPASSVIPITTSPVTNSSSSPLPQSLIITSEKLEDLEKFFDFEINEESRRPKKHKTFRLLFPRRKKKDKLLTYYIIESNTTPKPLFKRDTFNELEIPLNADSGGRFWFDYLHSSSTSEIVSNRETKEQDITPTQPKVDESTMATATKCEMKNVPIINHSISSTETKNNEKKQHKVTTQGVKNISNINDQGNALKSTITEIDSELVAENLSDDINQFLKLFGNVQDIESVNKNSNRSTQFFNSTYQQDSKVTNKPTATKTLKFKSSANTYRKNKTTTSIRTTEKSIVSNKTTNLKTKSTISKSTAPLSLEDLEKEVSAVFSTKVTGYLKKVTSKKYTRPGKKHTKANTKNTKASTHKSVKIISKGHESSSALSHANTKTKTTKKTLITASQQTTQNSDNTINPMTNINKMTSLTDITTVTQLEKDKTKSRKIHKYKIFGHLKAATLRFLGITRRTHSSQTTAKMEDKSDNALVEKMSKAETEPINSGDFTGVPTRQDPSLVTFNDYEIQLMNTIDRNARKSDYKNLLSSMIQFESNKLREEWKKLVYGSNDAQGSSKHPPANKDKSECVPGLLKDNKNTKSTVKNVKSTKIDIIEDVTNLVDFKISEPVETVNFDLNKYMKRPGLFDKIASKMGIKIISTDKTTEKAAKQSYFKEAELKDEKNKCMEQKENINTREASDTYIPSKFVCDLQSTYNHVAQLRNELMLKEFETYVKKIPCYKYKRIPKNFYIHHKTGGLKWDWIRNKRSLGHWAKSRFKESKNDNDDNSKEHCNVFETYVKDDDGIYRVGSRKKRNTDENNEKVSLESLPPILPATNEVYFMLDDSLALDCLSHDDLRSANQGQFTWEAERKDMLEQDNVQVDGGNLLIRKAGPRNSGIYSCSLDDMLRRRVRVVVVTLPTVDVVFVPVYSLARECCYPDLKAIQQLGEEMTKVISCGDVCTVRVDEPVCQLDKATNQSLIRSTTVLSLSPVRVRCGVQCRRDVHTSMVRLAADNVPALRNTKVILSRDGTNDTLTPYKDVSDTLITHKLHKKDSNGHQEYRRLSYTDKMHVVSVCGAGYYLLRDQNICAPCPSNTKSSLGENSCTPCPEGTSSDPGSKECHRHHKRHTRYDWWWYPPCGYLVASVAVLVGCALCVLLSLLVQLLNRTGMYRDGLRNAGNNTSTISGRIQCSSRRPLSPSRVLLARFFKPSLTSSRATAVDSQETRFELWKERNIPPPLPPIDFDLGNT